jgi:glycosyltransferase involved in cell wall biosynthesis
MSRRLKILHLVSHAGSNTYFCDIAEHANRERFDITVASLSPAGPLQDEMRARGLQTFALDCTTRSQYFRAQLRLAARLRRERFDIVQTHLFEASLVGFGAARLARTPLTVFTGHHSHEIPLHRKSTLTWADSLASRRLAHYVIAHCLQMKEIFMEEEGVPAEKIALIPLGFDFTRLIPSATARQRVRTELGLDGKVVFGAIGRLYWVKDYPSLFKAFAALASKAPDTVLLVIGDGPDRDKLKQLARELSLEDRIIFALHRSDIVDVLAAIDVLVHSALAESFGQVIIEAFALSKPVVSTEVGISREIIEDGVNGFLVPVGDTAALQAAFEKILQARDRWEAMGSNGQKRVQQFAMNKIVPAYEAQYIAWLKQRGKLNGAGTI